MNIFSTHCNCHADATAHTGVWVNFRRENTESYLKSLQCEAIRRFSFISDFIGAVWLLQFDAQIDFFLLLFFDWINSHCGIIEMEFAQNYSHLGAGALRFCS